jgi:hypothetical protein
MKVIYLTILNTIVYGAGNKAPFDLIVNFADYITSLLKELHTETQTNNIKSKHE